MFIILLRLSLFVNIYVHNKTHNTCEQGATYTGFDRHTRRKPMAIIHDKKTGEFYGISREARRLGVSPGHLSRIVHGKRISKRLMKQVRIKEAK